MAPASVFASVSPTATPSASTPSLSETNDFLSFNSMVHLVSNHKLDATNYFIWFNQVEPILICSDLYQFCDGTSTVPPKTLSSSSENSAPIVNPAYKEWVRADQRVRTLLQASLTLEAAYIVVGYHTSHQLWITLQATFSHASTMREIQLKDELQSLRQGDQSVADYSKKFKDLCDQLAIMGRAIDATDKLHWFLRGLGESFTQFAFTHLSLTPLPSFEEMVSKSISFEIFHSSMANRTPTQVAFYSNNRPTTSTRINQQQRNTGRGNSSNSSRGGYSCNGRGGKRTSIPCCQICGIEGHKAVSCPQRRHRSHDAPTFYFRHIIYLYRTERQEHHRLKGDLKVTYMCFIEPTWLFQLHYNEKGSMAHLLFGMLGLDTLAML